MLITEEYNDKFTRTYSDSGYYIIGENDEKYLEAIDPKEKHRVYTESDELIPPEPTEYDEDDIENMTEEEMREELMRIREAVYDYE